VYGPNLRAVAVYLVVFQHVPVERAALLIADLCGASVSTGWVSARVGSVSNGLCVSSVPDSEVAGVSRVLGEERTR